MEITDFQSGDLIKISRTEEVKEILEIEDGYIIMTDNSTYSLDEVEDVSYEEMQEFSHREYWKEHDRVYGDFRNGDIIKYAGEILVISEIKDLMGVKFIVCTNGRTIFDTVNVKIDTFVELRRKDEQF